MKKRFINLLPLLMTISVLGGCNSSSSKFTVTFNGNGGQLKEGKEVQEVANASEIVAPTYTYNDHSFTGWDKDLKTITSSTTVKALWDVALTITFNGNGGTRTGGGEETQIVKKASDIVAPIYSKEGYTFSAWDKNISSITTSTTVNALWSRNPSTKYTVTFDAKGGTRTKGGNLVQEVTHTYEITEPEVYREGYHFVGWDKNREEMNDTMTVNAIWEEKHLSGLAIKKIPNATQYAIGEVFDLLGINMVGTYSDLTKEIYRIDEMILFNIDPFSPGYIFKESDVGIHIIEFEYDNQVATFEIEVVDQVRISKKQFAEVYGDFYSFYQNNSGYQPSKSYLSYVNSKGIRYTDLYTIDYDKTTSEGKIEYLDKNTISVIGTPINKIESAIEELEEKYDVYFYLENSNSENCYLLTIEAYDPTFGELVALETYDNFTRLVHLHASFGDPLNNIVIDASIASPTGTGAASLEFFPMKNIEKYYVGQIFVAEMFLGVLRWNEDQSIASRIATSVSVLTYDELGIDGFKFNIPNYTKIEDVKSFELIASYGQIESSSETFKVFDANVSANVFIDNYIDTYNHYLDNFYHVYNCDVNGYRYDVNEGINGNVHFENSPISYDEYSPYTGYISSTTTSWGYNLNISIDKNPSYLLRFIDQLRFEGYVDNYFEDKDNNLFGFNLVRYQSEGSSTISDVITIIYDFDGYISLFSNLNFDLTGKLSFAFMYMVDLGI